MQESKPSRTALRVALRRAAHQLYDDPIVFDDPIAVPILGKQYAEELRRTPLQAHRVFSTALRAFIVARSCYAEENLRRAVENGIRQYVLLGAGLDTFAYRNPYPQLRVFEVDHPSTQQWKRELLSTNNIAIPTNLTFVPVDFETQSLSERLLASGFDPEAQVFFAWLGVVPYLTLAAFRSTLAFVAAQKEGSGLVFDYGQPRHVLSPNEQLAHDALASRVQLSGEPFQLFFTPEEAVAELSVFKEIEDLGGPAITARYFANRNDNLAIRGDSGRMVSAWL